MATPTRIQLSGSKKRKIKEEKQKKIKRMAGSMMEYVVKLTPDADPEPEIVDFNDCDPKKILSENFEISCSETPPKNSGMNEDDETGTEQLPEDVEHRDRQEILSENFETVPCSKTPPKSSGINNVDVFLLKKNDEIDMQQLTEDIALVKYVNDEIREHFVRYPPSQNMEFISHTERIIGNKKRCLSDSHFYRYKCNGEKVKRDWLTLSPTALALFCWICKIFSQTTTTLSGTGFSDWKHATERLREHENSFSHREAVCLMIQRRQVTGRVDCQLVEKVNCESKYWYEVLRRVVAVTKFLAIRGLPFFGRNETIGSSSNGNFLGCLELISEFDPFLAKHLDTSGNPGSGHTSYLSSSTINEFIDLMAKKVFDIIISEIKCAKFYSIILDSTPDLSHTDQLTFVIRYISSDFEPIERFLTFISISSHSSQYLEETVVKYIDSVGLKISDCRGQSYDNASNMAGKYTGLQSRLKALNPLIEFIPCSAHSLNLVVVKVVECNGKVLDFFTFLQELYNFFSSSTHRWNLLNAEMKGKRDFLTLKSRAVTRWCANAAATKALRHNYAEVMKVLVEMSLNLNESPSARREASSLHKKMLKLETAICATTWDTVLQRVDCTSKILQNPSLDLSQVPTFFTSLIDFVTIMRDQYEVYEEEASTLVGHKDYSTKRQTKTPKQFYDGQCEEAILDSKQSFKVSCFYAICDNLITNLNFRMSAYDGVIKNFSCLFECDKKNIRENASKLQKAYSCDLEESFPDELIHATSIIETEKSTTEKLRKINNLGIMDTFANVDTALKLFLTLPISNCSGERSFSLLKRIKGPLRTLISDSKLSSLALLSIEGDLTVKIDYEDVINEFTAKKQRRKYIKNH